MIADKEATDLYIGDLIWSGVGQMGIIVFQKYALLLRFNKSLFYFKIIFYSFRSLYNFTITFKI